MTVPCYPLLLERHLDDRVWGGQKLAALLDLAPPYPDRIAESWQVYDSNRVRNGAMAGLTLAQVTQEWREKLVGTLSLPRYGADFPLLVKFIDAKQDLSIQVHPDDDYAHRVEKETGYHGKNEAWYILDAKPGTSLYYHLRHPVSRSEFSDAVRDNNLEPLLNRRSVQPGDVVFVPAGTLHTINAGIVLFEIQQKSDLTYRVYDYGRPRPLHLEKALDVIAYDQPPLPPPVPLVTHESQDEKRTILVACRHFAMELWELAGLTKTSTQTSSVEIITLIDGEGRLSWDGGELELKRGGSVVLPAVLGDYEIRPYTAISALRCTVPDLERDILVPLRGRGYSSSAIERVAFDL